MLAEVFGHVPELIYLLPTACFALNKTICFCNSLPFLFVFHFHNYFFPACVVTWCAFCNPDRSTVAANNNTPFQGTSHAVSLTF